MNHNKIQLIALLLSVFINIPASAVNSPAPKPSPVTPQTKNDSLLLEAQKYNQQGADYLAAGKAKLALEQWQQAHKIYMKLQDREGILGTEINQAQAYQALGYYRQALIVLQSTNANLKKEPDSPLKARGLLSLGNTLMSLRSLEAKNQNAAGETTLGAKETLGEALRVAMVIQDPDLVNQIKFSLGNTLQLINAKKNEFKKVDANALENEESQKDAMDKFREVRDSTTSTILRVQSKINLYRIELNQGENENTLKFIKDVRSELASIPPSRSTIYAYVNLARIIQNHQKDGFSDKKLLMQIGELLGTAISQARAVKDARGEAQAVGALGSLYQLTAQNDIAEKLTKQALVISEGLPAPDISYRLQWQLGKILAVTNPQNTVPAITAYRQAVAHLKVLRNDLNASDADLQFSFRDSVEPVYRELVDLLLKDENKVQSENLSIARDLIESLQVAELENFLRQGCLDTYTVKLDEVDRSAAVIYPIILGDRVAVITSIPQQPLRYHSRPISEAKVEETVTGLINKVKEQAIKDYVFSADKEEAIQKESKKVYDLLIAPLDNDLRKSNIKTLVFIADGAFRNLPMSMLYDGKNYLVEKYGVALTPGLQLVPPKDSLANKDKQYKVFLGGVSEARQGFDPLPNVILELDYIHDLVPGQKLVNADFSRSSALNNLATNDLPIVHFATHGKFGSSPEDTFILTWDERLNLNQLSNALENRNLQSGKAIDLLVLSACETAVGDNRTTLGIAGVAIRAKTRSTIASLWTVDDKSTQLLMTNFYRNLVTKKLSKAESLRAAQQSLLNTSKHRSPYFWAPFILVGNW